MGSSLAGAAFLATGVVLFFSSALTAGAGEADRRAGDARGLGGMPADHATCDTEVKRLSVGQPRVRRV